ncbi:hypothetical protein DEU45_1571, partial [Bacillus sp. AG102]
MKKILCRLIPMLLLIPFILVPSNVGSGAKKLNDLKIFFQTWPYWYYYLKKVRDQDG